MSQTPEPVAPQPARRPGEAIFAALLLAGSLVLLWQAWNIAGPSRLSAARSVPVSATAIMSGAMLIVLIQTLRRPRPVAAYFRLDILPGQVVLIVGMLVGYALLLRPLGFLPTSALFLLVAIKLLSRGSWWRATWISVVSVLAIWVIFRLVFTVLMPQGIVPEGQIVQVLRDLLAATTAGGTR
jgi:putative tricarboxylic transport membrane protein